ncbi:amino acid-binding protein [Haladaptatus sp. CMAA 1911]|uniref:amino acid-binding protein n=1 Tax=unclassified Haladaptatus TaxID=2622732 RepID=UPI003753FC4F
MTDHGGGPVQAYTVRLELSDEPGELLRALEPIADYGGNLLSVFHERGSLTPRGNIPVEVDFECHPNRFDTIVSALRTASINVIRAGAERYDEEVTVILTGHIIDTDVSDTLSRITTESNASVVDISLSAPEGTGDVSSARLRLATDSADTRDVLDTVGTVADEKELRVIGPLTDGEEVA